MAERAAVVGLWVSMVTLSRLCHGEIGDRTSSSMRIRPSRHWGASLKQTHPEFAYGCTSILGSTFGEPSLQWRTVQVGNTSSVQGLYISWRRWTTS